MQIELTEHDVKLISWAVSTAINALVLEQERDEPQLSQESATIMVRKLHTLETKLADTYHTEKTAEEESTKKEE